SKVCICPSVICRFLYIFSRSISGIVGLVVVDIRALPIAPVDPFVWETMPPGPAIFAMVPVLSLFWDREALLAVASELDRSISFSFTLSSLFTMDCVLFSLFADGAVLVPLQAVMARAIIINNIYFFICRYLLFF